MDRGGPFAGDGAPGDAGDEGFAPRGWLPPDDRLWRHPSELGKLGGEPVDLTGLDLPDVPGLSDPDQDLLPAGGFGRSMSLRPVSAVSRRPAAVVLVATVVMAAALVVFVAERPAAAPGGRTKVLAANATSLTTAVAPAPRLRTTVQQVRRSLVGLVVDPAGGALVTGVAAGGGLVITAAAAVSGASILSAILPDGRSVHATLLGTDPRTGVAVVDVPQPLPSASFAGQNVTPGELAMTECLCDSSAAAPASRVRSAPAAKVALATVEAVGTSDASTSSGRAGSAAASGSMPLLDTIQADHAPMPQQAWGGVLVDGGGQVAGILDAETTTSGEPMDVFVPGWLARRVAEQLAADHHVDHGWLGITGTSGAGPCGGASVVAVLAGAPAAGMLSPGDVIEAVDGQQVCTWAELQAATYVLPAGDTVDLQVSGPGGVRSIAMALGSSPG